jgi:hypothetical protein
MIFVTGGAFTPRGQQFLASVKNARVEKPFNVDSLLHLIRAQVGGLSEPKLAAM